MLHRIINKKFVISWLISLLMLIFYSATADSRDYQYTLLLAGGNPWAIPQAQDNYQDFQQSPYENRQYQGEPENSQNQRQSTQHRMYQNNRFVTDEFLKSLKQQQSQFQVMPDYRRNPQYAPRQSVPQQPQSNIPGSGTYGNPAYGTGYVNPLGDTLSDVPVVRPWSPWDIGVSDW